MKLNLKEFAEVTAGEGKIRHTIDEETLEPMTNREALSSENSDDHYAYGLA